MDPYDEQRLREEVIYLHTLWHLGPPPPRSTSTNFSNTLLHQFPNRTQFKRQRPKPRAQRRNWNNRNQGEVISSESIQDSGKEWPCNPTSNSVASACPIRNVQSNSQLSWHSAESGKEWPCNPTSDATTQSSAWPTVTAQLNSQPISLSPEQQARLAANRAQAKALKATKEFLRSNTSDDDEIGDDDDNDKDLGKDEHDGNEGEDYDDHDNLTKEEYGIEEYRFFINVFKEDSDLRGYYQKNYQNGDFSCLVCHGVGMKKASKRFKDCIALIQHSVSIAKTKKRLAHRAYAKAICKVLGWEIHKLPTIVSALSAKDGVSLSHSGASEGEAQGHVVDETKDNPNVLGGTEAQPDIGNGDKLQEKESTSNETKPNNNEAVDSQEKSLVVADTSKCDEDPNLKAPNIAEDEGLGQPSDLDTVVGDEGKDAVSHDFVKNDSAS